MSEDQKFYLYLKTADSLGLNSPEGNSQSSRARLATSSGLQEDNTCCGEPGLKAEDSQS